MTSMYGFIVVAWLVLPFNDGQVAVPFAAMAQCERALSLAVRGAARPRNAFCVLTGAEGRS